MKQRRGSGAWTGVVTLALGCLLFAVIALVVLAASAGRGGAADAPVRAPSLSLLLGLVAAGVMAVGIAVLASLLRTLRRGELQDRKKTIPDLIRLAVVFVLLVVVFRILPIDRRGTGSEAPSETGPGADTVLPQTTGTDWATLVLVAGAALYIAWRVWRSRRSAATGDLTSSRLAAAVAEVLDDTIERLRNEPDPRLAVIAAYARMEDVFARHGLPRRPSETALEFLARALEAVTETGPARRLTNLFELAMFSTRPFDRAAQDEAIDALVEVRDDVRRQAGRMAAA
jgi:hypothetical protein